MLMIWQLLQVRHVDNVPLILVGNMWRGLVDWARTAMLDPRLAFANDEDLQIPQRVDARPSYLKLVRSITSRLSVPRVNANRCPSGDHP